MYKARLDSLNKAVKKFSIRGSVLDVGCGTGFFIDFWNNKRFRITGMDITKISIDRLRSRYPFHTFVRADISNTYFGEFDIVTAFDVLSHIVDDEKWEQALTNICKMAENWILIFIFVGSIVVQHISVLFPESNIVIWWVAIILLATCYLVSRPGER